MTNDQPALFPITVDWRAEIRAWPADKREAWEERSAIMEYDGNMDRETAERKAWEVMR